MRKKNSKTKFNVILVEPEGPLNIGNIARLCANFEINELRIVNPRCKLMSKEATIMAVHGKSFLENAKEFSTLIEAISDCNKIIATCGRIDHGSIPLSNTEESLRWLFNSKDSTSMALVFGRESRGLTNDELQYAQKVINLKTSETYPSLNLSHAVAIVLYELQKLKEEEEEVSNSISLKKNIQNPSYPIELNNFLKDSQDLLLEIGFLLDHTSKARMAKLKGILQRAEIRSEEIALIRGIVRQVRWAINQKR